MSRSSRRSSAVPTSVNPTRKGHSPAGQPRVTVQPDACRGPTLRGPLPARSGRPCPIGWNARPTRVGSIGQPGLDHRVPPSAARGPGLARAGAVMAVTVPAEPTNAPLVVVDPVLDSGVVSVEIPSRVGRVTSGLTLTCIVFA